MISWQINFFNFLLSKINRNRNIYLSIFVQSLQDVSGLDQPPHWSWSTPDWSSSLNVFPFQSPLQTCVNKYTCSQILSHSFTLTVGSKYSPLYIYIYIVVLCYLYKILLPCQTNCPGRNFAHNEWKSHGQDGPSSSASI